MFDDDESTDYHSWLNRGHNFYIFLPHYEKYCKNPRCEFKFIGTDYKVFCCRHCSNRWWNSWYKKKIRCKKNKTVKSRKRARESFKRYISESKERLKFIEKTKIPVENPYKKKKK